MNTILPF